MNNITWRFESDGGDGYFPLPPAENLWLNFCIFRFLAAESNDLLH